ncbi:hypothetical protein SAMN02745883_00711 [Caminicella sporogenes DSM 14501]|uniref:Uncharacterized protein n=1 Tax=Caminicella sporogenes DSM 14501 TaxID=1121266 RepID=A0A1M6MYT5_9FIRM|nr:type II restriction endonuclease subunit M [Caminicella sporogenes]RKD22437.1 type II restriction endonuclease subunit M [Caminicella sporogenes]SHJ88627.1 hypothetical protein SAMN02745883_00711 [Caminicella sporogenes DSM 14501]
MKYKTITGKIIDTDKQDVYCPLCGELISKEDINNGSIYKNGIDNPETSECWCELWHIECAEIEEEYEREYGYRM